mgnify:CR=1 FL=1
MQKNFSIKNLSGDTAEIKIFGEIGEGWFGDGVTLDSVKTQLEGIKAKKINVLISSLGGDVNHALAIHDILKMSNAEITTEIIGATASSGTIIAMAGKERKMSNNALFLSHNAWMLAVGNADQLRKQADDLDAFNDRIINIYQKVTGKSREQVKALMDEEKWIDADNAKDFGFVTETFEPVKAAACIDFNAINASKLPKVPENIIQKINAMKESKDEQSLVEKIVNAVKNVLPKKEEGKEIKEVSEEQIQNIVKAELEKVKNDEAKSSQKAIEDKEKEIQNLNEKLNAANTKAQSLETQLSAANAVETVVKNDTDPSITNCKTRKTQNQISAEKNAAALRDDSYSLTDEE